MRYSHSQRCSKLLMAPGQVGPELDGLSPDETLSSQYLGEFVSYVQRFTTLTKSFRPTTATVQPGRLFEPVEVPPATQVDPAPS